jgi:2-phospho-L-lactate guanylyltransferase (CobY/MobA/RfbA family)
VDGGAMFTDHDIFFGGATIIFFADQVRPTFNGTSFDQNCLIARDDG